MHLFFGLSFVGIGLMGLPWPVGNDASVLRFGGAVMLIVVGILGALGTLGGW